jgi:NADH-quinone oxidoreductase E subunit
MTVHMQFVFHEDNIKKAKNYIQKYPVGQERSAIKALLDLAQRQEDVDGTKGWLSNRKIEYIADFLKMPVVKVYEVASFYTMFNLKPVGMHHIKVCGTVPCCLVGSEDIRKTCEDELGIKVGETTKDKLFTLAEVECLGACVNAPIVQIGDDYFEDLNKESMTLLINNLKDGTPIKPGSYKQNIK